MSSEPSLEFIKKEWHGSLKAYIIGFISSLILTSASFLLVITRVISGKNLVYSIVGLALVQAVFQLIFFLHLGQESKPRWQLWIFLFMLFILLIIVIGSLWIMNDLNERMMSNMPMMEMSHD